MFNIESYTKTEINKIESQLKINRKIHLNNPMVIIEKKIKRLE